MFEEVPLALAQGASMWAHTGYGEEARIWWERFEKEGYLRMVVAALAGVQGTDHVWTSPSGREFHHFPSDLRGGSLPHLCKELKPKIVFTLCDLWAISADVLKQLPRVAAWMPIDCEPLSDQDKTVLYLAKKGGADIRPIAMSRFGQRQLLNEGIDCHYVPHSCETHLWCPDPEVRPDPNYFTIGINATNIDPVRKALVPQLYGFEAFHREYPESRLLLHTAPKTPPGKDLLRLIDRLGIGQCAVFPENEYRYHAGLYGEDYMIEWTRRCDMISHASAAEGFGRGILQGMAVGIPVIGVENSSMTELLPTKWLIPKERTEPWFVDSHGASWRVPHVDEIYDKYCLVRNTTQEHLKLEGELARKFVVDNYDVEHVWRTYWKPTLEALLHE